MQMNKGKPNSTENASYPQHKGQGLAAEIGQAASTVMLAGESLKKQLAKQDVDVLTKEAQACFQAFEQCALRLSRAAENMDEWMAFCSGDYKIEPVMIDLGSQYEKTMTLCQKSAAAKEIQLTYQNLLEKDQLICADARVADKLLLNLISNAMRAAKKIEVCLENADGHPRLTVSDDGPGLSEAAKNHLYEAFSTDFVSNQQGGGSGLGLYLVNEYCKRMNWEIQLDSSKQGTRVVIAMKDDPGEGAQLGSHFVDLAFDVEQEHRVELELSVLT